MHRFKLYALFSATAKSAEDTREAVRKFRIATMRFQENWFLANTEEFPCLETTLNVNRITLQSDEK
jgi:hypothetical protein